MSKQIPFSDIVGKTIAASHWFQGADRTLGATTVCWELFVFTDNTFALRAISKNPLSSRIGCCSDPTIPCQPHDHRLLAHLLSRELITTEEYDVLRNGGTQPK